MEHQGSCDGEHRDDLSCATSILLAEQVASDPWFCHGQSRTGYHLFDGLLIAEDAVCLYGGCQVRYGDLNGLPR
jgi:hypothetical protein